MSVDRIAALVATVVVVAAIGIGLYVTGTPGEQRLARFDQQRVVHLTQIRQAVDGYWQEHRALPARVDSAVIGIRLKRIPRDPETDAAYEYAVTSVDGYRLCAVFSLPSAEHLADEFWAHGAGRQCFDFTVKEHGAD